MTTQTIVPQASAELMLTESIPAERHPAVVYLASLGRGSVPAQRSVLNKIAAIFGATMQSLDWGALRYQHVQAIRARLMETYSATTANRLLTALRRVLKEAWKLGYIPEEEYRKLADIEAVRGSKDDTDDELMGRALSIGELTAIMGACADDNTLAGVRDSAVIALGYGLGLRRAEIAKFQVSHYNRQKSTLAVRSGKGNKNRTLPIDDGAQEALEDWLNVRGEEPGPVFYGVN
jgi:site-specific recombinase XerC